jgi:hypothetical protein
MQKSAESKNSASEVEKAKEVLRKERERAKAAGAHVSKKTRSKNFDVKNFSGKDFESNKDYYVALLNIVPIIGATHWFSAADDVGDDGNKIIRSRNCSANLLPDNSFGSNVEVCPACYLAKQESEYYKEHNELPPSMIPVDVYKGKPNGPGLLIYYYAIIGVPKEIVKEDANGNETTVTRIEWWKEEGEEDYKPVVLQIKPSINNILAEQLDNMDAYEGDIRSYIWRFHKKATNDFEKYSKTGPLMQKGALVPVSEKILANRDKYIASLPSTTDLLSPTSAEEMAELLDIEDWGGKKVKDKEKPVDSGGIDINAIDDADEALSEDDGEKNPVEDEVSAFDVDDLDNLL